MFFNVSREKSGRPGRSGDVIGRGLGRGCVSPPTRPRNLLHVCTELESSQHRHRGPMYRPRRSDRENSQQNDNGWSSGSTLHLEEESLDSNL